MGKAGSVLQAPVQLQTFLQQSNRPRSIAPVPYYSAQIRERSGNRWPVVVLSVELDALLEQGCCSREIAQVVDKRRQALQRSRPDRIQSGPIGLGVPVVAEE